MYDFMWKEDSQALELKNATSKVERFFEKIKSGEKGDLIAGGVKLSYRVGQHRFARDVMTAIRDNQILLVQAGVGIGKSIGYLVPVIETIHQVKSFNSVVISTSNIALQQQLLMDIQFVSRLLGIDIKATIAKGVNNYACLKRIDDLISISDREDKALLFYLREEMEMNHTIDRDELREVSDDIWKQIQIKSRGACSRCSYSRNCLYRNISKSVSKSDIVITNHGNFVKSVIDDRDYINEADMFIFDEAHQLENAISGIEQGILNLSMIHFQINYYIVNCWLEKDSEIENASLLIHEIDKLFSNIRKSASLHFRKNNQEGRNLKIMDCDRISFDNNSVAKIAKSIAKKLDKFILDITYRKKQIGNYNQDARLNVLKEYLDVFRDMAKGMESDNIYWADYYRNNKIHIGYVSKSNINITQNIFGRGIPIVCTSGTLLDANGGYHYFKNGLSFDQIRFNNQTVVDGRTYFSPYNYAKNSLFYYDNEVANPKNYIKYVQDLVVKIEKLLRVTNGRSLVLFTSKSTMESVYKELEKREFDFKLLLQGTMSNSQICSKFQSDVKSCLFATGAFWEGIDIAGKSLCNVIITRLPFANVDAVTESRAAEFSKGQAFRMVYLNDMAQKMAQGIGRLIRSSRDKGIICCLDSRCENYIDVIKSCTPYTNFTRDIEDVYEFSSKYIINRDGKRKVKKLECRDATVDK